MFFLYTRRNIRKSLGSFTLDVNMEYVTFFILYTTYLEEQEKLMFLGKS